MEKVGIAVVGALILIILIVGWANRGSREEQSDRRRDRDAGAGLQVNTGEPGDEDVVNADIFEPFGKGGEVVIGGDEPPLVDPNADPNADPKVDPDPVEVVLPPTPEPRPTLLRHKLASGETLSLLAQKYLGKASRWPAIVKANPDLDPNRLRVGAEIVIPDRGALDAELVSARARAPRSEVRPAARPTFIPDEYVTSYAPDGVTKPVAELRPDQYRVEKGDTLGAIAQKKLGSVRHANKIFEANRDLMKNPNDLRVGWVLQIPGID